MNTHAKTYPLVLSALFLALCLVLPIVTGGIPAIGNMLLPMHIPVLFCGLICGWQYGLVIGFAAPLLRSALFGMPPLYPVALAMSFELAAYGLIIGAVYALLRKGGLAALYTSLLTAMVGGRLVWGLAEVVLLGLAGKGFTLQAFLSGALLTAVPGIVLQLVLIPAVMTRPRPHRRRRASATPPDEMNLIGAAQEARHFLSEPGLLFPARMWYTVIKLSPTKGGARHGSDFSHPEQNRTGPRPGTHPPPAGKPHDAGHPAGNRPARHRKNWTPRACPWPSAPALPNWPPNAAPRGLHQSVIREVVLDEAGITLYAGNDEIPFLYGDYNYENIEDTDCLPAVAQYLVQRLRGYYNISRTFYTVPKHNGRSVTEKDQAGLHPPPPRGYPLQPPAYPETAAVLTGNR